uniref:Uncharacterized protein n=1 Tax=Romanomermis culicivorax TaxID=13658 RepID=A0A915J239_ROMCU
MMKNNEWVDIFKELTLTESPEILSPFKVYLQELRRDAPGLTKYFVGVMRWCECENSLKAAVSRKAASALLKLICDRMTLSFAQFSDFIKRSFAPDFYTNFFLGLQQHNDFDSFIALLSDCKIHIFDILDHDNRPIVERNSIIGNERRLLNLTVEIFGSKNR